jgi:methionyl-tRNA formyltransferase
MMPRIALFTSQDIGFQIVERLSADPVYRGALHVFADRSTRDDLYGYRSAIDACAAANIPCTLASRVDQHTLEQVRQFAPALIVAVYYPHFLPPSLLALARMGGINIHPGKLPEYRGKFPTPWYILRGDTHFGLAIHRIDAGIDTGDVYVQEQFPIPPAITGHELYRLTQDEGANLMVRTLPRILAGELTPTPQQGVGSYFSSIERTWRIDWNLSSETIERRVRVHAKPYLPAHTQLFNRLLFINRVRPAAVEGYRAQGGGRILAVTPDGGFIVSTCDGCLLVEDYEVAPSWTAQEQRLSLREGVRFD